MTVIRTRRRLAQMLYSNLLNREATGLSKEAGLTLLECIIAIVVVGVVGVTIAPAMVVSVATRVQSQKAEQALQLAQGEIDQIRLEMERDGQIPDDRIALATVAYTDLADAGAPTGLTTNDIPTLVQAREIDLDNDGDADFAIQVFRSQEDVSVTDASGDTFLQAFGLGVRVYDIEAFNSGETLLTDEGSLGFTSTEGDRERNPLAVLYTTVNSSETGNSFCDYVEFTDPTADKPLGCS